MIVRQKEVLFCCCVVYCFDLFVFVLFILIVHLSQGKLLFTWEIAYHKVNCLSQGIAY